MKITGKMEYYKDIPIYAPNDTFELQEKGCYVSYNNYSIRDYGSDTTALVRMDGIHPTKFLILNGNHTKEYYALGKYDDCVEYFKHHLDQKNKLSENWDEEIITRPDGTIYVTKIDRSGKNMNEKEVELNDLMIARADLLDGCIYQMLLTLLEIEPEDADSKFPWDISIIRETLDAITDILAQHGMYVCDPYVEYKEEKSYLCTTEGCGCEVCIRQEKTESEREQP